MHLSSAAQCNEQKNYTSNWIIDKNNVTININKKDNSDFNYYQIKGMGEEIYIGISFLDTPLLQHAKSPIFLQNNDKSILHSRLNSVIINK